ncbi:uncharacterized protein MCYG_03066 [Microsporum canis CBS 113480]|uniref:GAG-pre-integrase domain-containing protein n=1 Tax=Arthroderma otae (strain ATCC MYA-4605 / CBS 113480) TaxID=554155 RepID=C5FKM5_ARTOC|nr:uncharacterized protein MCYG_03066 [Microsporum canis CBS 113480]EEQ30247.1 predicted protein [Microsporum canis CBS 113480]
MSSYHPRNSVVYDTAANNHIVNDKNRFLTMESFNDEVLTGDNTTRVMGRGDARIWMTSPKGTISGYTFDTEAERIRHKKSKKEVAIMRRIYPMWVVKFNEPELLVQTPGISAFSSSREPKMNVANEATWHRRLGHPNNEVLRHVEELSDDIEIVRPKAPNRRARTKWR